MGTLCAQTKTTNPVYVVTNLEGNNSYMMDIRAVNKVGPGDPCEFQITTAAVAPDPPPKPFVPGESKATWVDMGTVGAAANERSEPATYDAWVGPLEESCEYRFQIVAMSNAGTSKVSELSDAYYT